MDVNYFIRTLALKDMGEALLVAEIEERAVELHILGEVSRAIKLAAVLHRNQRRSNRGTLPKDTYITHPLRNTLRLLRYGVTNRDIIVAEILHDTVEDAAKEMINFIPGSFAPDLTDAEMRKFALKYIGNIFGVGVQRIVEAMSNPLPTPGTPKLSKSEKRAEYGQHVVAAIEDPEVAVSKLGDFVDNAVGLYHNTAMLPIVRYHLALKYLPLVPVFEAKLEDPEVARLLTPAGVRQAEDHLAKGDHELRKILVEVDSGE